jgi:hypothetical protein
MPVNATWHRSHPIPARSTLAQRLAWHREHQQHCACRPMPASLTTAPPAFVSLLSGGDRRSLAQAPRVLAIVEREPSRLRELVSLLDASDPLVVQRSLDVLEKVARRDARCVQPFRARFLELADSDRWEVLLQLVRLLPLLTWTGRQRARVQEILRSNLSHPRAFVRAWALDGLAALAGSDAEQRTEVRKLAAQLAATDDKAVQVRARAILARTG